MIWHIIYNKKVDEIEINYSLDQTSPKEVKKLIKHFRRKRIRYTGSGCDFLDLIIAELDKLDQDE